MLSDPARGTRGLQPELSAQALIDNVVLISDGRVRAVAKRRVSSVVLVSSAWKGHIFMLCKTSDMIPDYHPPVAALL